MADNGEGSPIQLVPGKEVAKSIAEHNPNRHDKGVNPDAFLKSPDYTPTKLTSPAEAADSIALNNPDKTTEHTLRDQKRSNSSGKQ